MSRKRQETPITKYCLQDLLWRDLLRVFLPLFLLVLIPLGYGIWRTLYGYSSFGPAAAAKWGRIWFLISAILTLFVLLYSLRRLFRAHTWVHIFDWGLKVNSPLRPVRRLPWSEIQGITSYSVNKTFLGIINRKKDHTILYAQRYRPIRIHPDLKDRVGLIKIIKKHTYKNLQPILQKAFIQGRTIPFGGVSVSKAKLTLPKTEVPWDYVEGIKVQQGLFLVNLTEKNSLEVPIRNIINLEILLQLIKSEI